MMSYLAYTHKSSSEESLKLSETEPQVVKKKLKKIKSNQFKSDRDNVTIKMNEKDIVVNIDDVDGGNIDDDGDQKNSDDENVKLQIDDTDGTGKAKNSYASKKSVAEGMMDIALLTANANQLRFLITYNQESHTFYVSVTLIAISLILQVAVGIALIFKVVHN